MVEGLPSTDWDSRVLAMGGSLLQGRQWAEFQAGQGCEVLHGSGDGWCALAVVKSKLGIRYLYLPYGPAADSPQAFAQAINALRAAAARRKCAFIRLEPAGDGVREQLILAGARESAEFQPRRTAVLDLTLPDEQLRCAVSQSNRNLINTAERRGVTFAQAGPDQLGTFLRLLRQTSSRAGITVYSDDYYRALFAAFGSQAGLHFALAEGQTVAAAITLDFGPTRYYAHAASDYELNRRHKAAVPLLWHLVTEAKAGGQTVFDFWGIAPNDDPDHKKAGLTKLKLSFGSTVVERIGTWEISTRPLAHLAYNSAKLLRAG